MKRLKQHKGIIIVATLVLVFTIGFIGGNTYLQHKLESKVFATSKDIFTNNTIAADNPEEAKHIDKQTSEQIEHLGDTQLEISYAYAEDLLKTMPDAPLLKVNVIPNDDGSIYGDSSLETAINDVNAATCAKESILRICKEAGIDANTATVSDLTIEQICEIDQEVFQNSSHGK